jgi:diguanylate cyclase (GGDEF)-like protein
MGETLGVSKGEISLLIKVLLIEDDSVDARLLRRMLGNVHSVHFRVTQVDRLSEAVKCLNAERFDVVLLDLSILDSWGLDTFVDLHAQAPDVPVVVLTGLDDETLAVEAVHRGAQDYLVKGKVSGDLLARAIRYAIERNRMKAELRSISLTDELTRLLNRRGFLTLAEHQIKVADRTGRGFLLFFVDIDGMKRINDTFGHIEGDAALIESARVLKETFRNSDIIARMGGDEFVVLAIDTSISNAEGIADCIQRKLDDLNARRDGRYKLSMSMGMAYYDPQCPRSLNELLNWADKLMYVQKQRKKANRA